MGNYDFSFPTDTFTVPGDPAAIRSSAVPYRTFSTTASNAAHDIRSLDAQSWVGDEGDEFRSRADQLPPPLENAASAFGQVTTALTTFADELQSAQARMASVSADAHGVWNRLNTAKDAVYQHGLDALRKDFPDDASRQQFEQEGAALQRGVSSAQGDWNAKVSLAKAVRRDAEEAARRAGQQIRAAARMSPTAGQSWFERHLERAGNWIDEHGAAVRNWIGEHANIIRGIGKALSFIGKVIVGIGVVLAAVDFVAGFFGGIPWLAEVPIFALIGWGATLWSVGDSLQTAADWGEGKIDGSELLVRIGLSGIGTVVGAGVGKLAGKAVEKWGPTIAKWLRGKGVRLPWLKGPDPVGVPEVPTGKGPVKGPGDPAKGMPGGKGGPALVGGTKEHPAGYTYRSPAKQFADAPAPSASELRRAGQATGDFPPGTREHMLKARQAYISKQLAEGKTVQPWEKWRNRYIQNLENPYRGKAFENAFSSTQGLTKDAGWSPQGVKLPDGSTRNLDLVNTSDPAHLRGYELKSGSTIVTEQLEKDKTLVANGWDITYVFGTEPTAATVKQLEKAGIPYTVWYAQGTPVP